MSNTFQKVVVEFSKDTLNGKVLRNEEKVIIRWPDATSTNTQVVVESKPTDAESIVTEEDGTVHKILHKTEERAYVNVQHKGVPLRVALRDSNLFLVRDI